MSQNKSFVGVLTDSVDGENITIEPTPNGGGDIGFYHKGKLLCAVWIDQLEKMVETYKDRYED